MGLHSVSGQVYIICLLLAAKSSIHRVVSHLPLAFPTAADTCVLKRKNILYKYYTGVESAQVTNYRCSPI